MELRLRPVFLCSDVLPRSLARTIGGNALILPPARGKIVRDRVSSNRDLLVNEQLRATLGSLLNQTSDNDVGLPAPSERQMPDDRVEELLRSVEQEIGAVADTDYYKCSRERFSHLIGLALRNLPKGATLVDVGSAPGYLGLALHKAGFQVHGLNLSDAWNSSYASPDHLRLMNVQSCDIEQGSLPFADSSVHGIVFTEVLEHIAITDPVKIVGEFGRVLTRGGVVVFSTPNVCNISNIIALMKGINIFWPVDRFYGSTDRHNREWTPLEVKQLFESNGFSAAEFYGASDHANWRFGAAADTYEFLGGLEAQSALLRNTIIGAFRKL